MDARYEWRRLQSNGIFAPAILLVGTAIALYLCYRMLNVFLPALTWAVGLAVLVYPLYCWSLKRLRKPNLAAGLTITLVSICLIVPVLLLGHQILQQMIAALTILKDPSTVQRWQGFVDSHPLLRRTFRLVQGSVDVRGQIENLLETVATSAPGLLKGSAGAVIELLVTLLTLFFFLRDKNSVLRLIRTLLPLPEEEIKGILHGVYVTIQGTFKGTIALAVVQGLIVAITFWSLDLPSPLLWGFVMGGLAFVPFLGVFAVWVPAAVFLGYQGHWVSAVIVSSCGTVVIGLLHNLLYPMFVGNEMNFHTLAVFFAMVGGMALFGAAGLLLGPIVLSVTWSLLKIWRQRVGHLSIKEREEARLAR